MDFLSARLPGTDVYAPLSSRTIEEGGEDRVVLETALTDIEALHEAGGIPITTSGNSLVRTLPHISLLDPFNNFRVSFGETQFDSKQLRDKNATLWDEKLNGAASSTHSAADSRTRLAVSAAADFGVRQSFQVFNYQPGKGIKGQFTTVMPAAADTVSRVGFVRANYTTPFAPQDGLWFEQLNGVHYVVQSKGGLPTAIPQSQWNYDKMDGSGPSGLTINWAKAQILHIDYEWLGVGTAAFAVVINRALHYLHFFHNANAVDSVYMSTPNLHVRYEVRSTGGSNFLDHICTTVISEGGNQDLGVVRAASREGTPIVCTNIGTVYPIMAIRVRSTHLDHVIKVLDYSVLMPSNDNAEILVLMNPTFAGAALSWSSKGVGVEVARPSNTTTISAVGDEIDVRHAQQRAGTATDLNSIRYQGVSIDGTRDIICLAARGITAGASIHGSLIWRELL